MLALCWFSFCIPKVLGTRAVLSTHRTLLSPTRKRVLSPLEHVPKRHKVSVGDKKLSSAPAPEQVPELQLFANLAIEEGAPPLSYWDGLCGQLKKVDCELDFPAIEELVFDCLVLGPIGIPLWRTNIRKRLSRFGLPNSSAINPRRCLTPIRQFV